MPGCPKQEEKGAILEVTESYVVLAFFTKDAMKDACIVLRVSYDHSFMGGDGRVHKCKTG